MCHLLPLLFGLVEGLEPDLIAYTASGLDVEVVEEGELGALHLHLLVVD